MEVHQEKWWFEWKFTNKSAGSCWWDTEINDWDFFMEFLNGIWRVILSGVFLKCGCFCGRIPHEWRVSLDFFSSKPCLTIKWPNDTSCLAHWLSIMRTSHKYNKYNKYQSPRKIELGVNWICPICGFLSRKLTCRPALSWSSIPQWGIDYCVPEILAYIYIICMFNKKREISHCYWNVVIKSC